MDGQQQYDWGDGEGSALPRVKVGYGVDLQGDRLLIVRAVRSRHRTSYSAVTAQDTAQWTKALAEFESGRALLAGVLPIRDSFTVWVSTPIDAIRKAARVLPSQLDIQLPFPLEDCVHEFLDIHRLPENGVRALAVAARVEDIARRLEMYRRCGVEPSLLDHEGLALWTQSLLEAPSQDYQAARVVIALNSGYATMAIGRGRRFVNAHTIRFDDDVAVNPDAKPLSSEDAERLVERTRTILHAEVEPDAAVEWCWCGALARDEEWIIHAVQRLSDERPGRSVVHREPEGLLARSLAERVVHPGILSCNLRKGSFVHPVLRRLIRRQTLRTAWLLLFSGLILCGVNGAWLLGAQHRVRQINSRIISACQELAPGKRVPYGQEMREVPTLMGEQSKTYAPFQNAFRPSVASAMTTLVRAGDECGLKYQSMTFQGNSVSILGNSEDWDRCAKLADRLKAMGYSRISLERQDALEDNRVRFAIKAERSL